MIVTDFWKECYFTYSHSPLRDADGRVVGVHSAVTETTARVVNERRLQVASDLLHIAVTAASESRSLAELCGALMDRLCDRNPDAPLAVLYLHDGSSRATRIASAGVDISRFPPVVSFEEEDEWASLRHSTVTS